VEGAPFVAVELDWTGDGRHQVLSFRTDIDGVVLWNAAEAAEKRKVLRQCCQCQFTFATLGRSCGPLRNVRRVAVEASYSPSS
jgi:hypothetical protein